MGCERSTREERTIVGIRRWIALSIRRIVFAGSGKACEFPILQEGTIGGRRRMSIFLESTRLVEVAVTGMVGSVGMVDSVGMVVSQNLP